MSTRKFARRQIAVAELRKDAALQVASEMLEPAKRHEERPQAELTLVIVVGKQLTVNG